MQGRMQTPEMTDPEVALNLSLQLNFWQPAVFLVRLHLRCASRYLKMRF